MWWQMNSGSTGLKKNTFNGGKNSSINRIMDFILMVYRKSGVPDNPAFFMVYRAVCMVLLETLDSRLKGED